MAVVRQELQVLDLPLSERVFTHSHWGDNAYEAEYVQAEAPEYSLATADAFNSLVQSAREGKLFGRTLEIDEEVDPSAYPAGTLIEYDVESLRRLNPLLGLLRPLVGRMLNALDSSGLAQVIPEGASEFTHGVDFKIRCAPDQLINVSTQARKTKDGKDRLYPGRVTQSGRVSVDVDAPPAHMLYRREAWYAIVAQGADSKNELFTFPHVELDMQTMLSSKTIQASSLHHRPLNMGDPSVSKDATKNYYMERIRSLVIYPNQSRS